jgi:hypothetical protein
MAFPSRVRLRRTFLLALAMLASAPADALILDSGDGQGNTSAPADDPGWAHVGQVSGPTGVYLGNGWVLTAAHVPAGNFVFGVTIYPFVPGSAVQLLNPDSSLADLHVFRIDPSPSLPLLRIRSTTPSNNTDVTMISQGLSRGAATSWMGHNGYEWGASTGMRWGTNRVAGTDFIGTWTVFTNFTKISQGGTTHEAQGANGDSGGAVFIKNGSDWELAGVMLAVGVYGGQPDSTALYGNETHAADLSIYRDQLFAVTRPKCANEVDDDGDSFVDWPADDGCASELDDSELPDVEVPALPLWGRLLLVAGVLLLGMRFLQRRGTPASATL